MRYHYTDRAIKAAKPGYNSNVNRKTEKPYGETDKPYKLPKEQGLYILVYPNRVDETGKVIRQGAKGWRHAIVVNGTETTLSYGNYPDVSLAEAREARDETLRKLRKGINPVAEKRSEKEARADTFKAIALEWLDAGCPPNKNGRPVEPGTIAQLKRRLEKYVFPRHGTAPVKDITVPEFHQTLRRITSRGRIETAHRVRSVASRVFRYAVATGRAERDPAADLRDALPSVQTQSFAAITEPKAIGALLRSLDTYDGQPAVMAALKLAPLVFVRPSELRGAEWDEIDLEGATWTIPARRMKMDRDHLVPLSVQAVEILEELRPITGHRKLVFPGIRSANRPISENTINGALRRLGYTTEQMTGHGFRSMASTRLNELGFDPNVIEAQLAHVDPNRVRGIYNRAEYIEKRKGMMQAWADYLDGLRADHHAKVVAING